MSPILTSAPESTAADESLDFGHFEDRDLTRRVVGFLVSHRLLNDASLLLRVNGGHVELRGTVTSFRLRGRIEAFVRRVAGVHHVTNQLVVGTPRRAHFERRRLAALRSGEQERAWPFHD